MQFVFEDVLLNKIIRHHLLSENTKWNYASFNNITLDYVTHKFMEFCVTSSLALDNWEQSYCQTLDNKPNPSLRVLRGQLFSKGKNLNYVIVCFTQCTLFFPQFVFYCIADLFAVRYLWVVRNENKCCVVTQRAAGIRVAWLVYVRTYCVPIATVNQNKRTRFWRCPNKKHLLALLI